MKKMIKNFVAGLVCASMALGMVCLPVTSAKASADTDTKTEEPSVSAYATPDQLKDPDNFTLHTDNGAGKVQWVAYGKDTWLIAGEDNGSLVLLCNVDNHFGDLPLNPNNNNKEFTSASLGVYPDGFVPETVCATHYGASELREYLTQASKDTDIFTIQEQALMKETTIYNNDFMNDRRVYATTDVLYLGYGNWGDYYFTIGSNSAEDLKSGIKVSITKYNIPGNELYWKEYVIFRLRTAYANVGNPIVVTGSGVGEGISTYSKCLIVPAFSLDTSSILFGSTATSASENASINSVMTFRINGADKVTSKAVYDRDRIGVVKHGDGEYLYVAYNDGEEDQVFSTAITENMEISALEAGVDSFDNCKVWIETYDENANLTYAVMAVNKASFNGGVGGFCERLYTCALNRNSDLVGIATWIDELESGRMNGAQVAAGFFFSDELKNSGITNEEFITRLYATFMDREPDPEGYKTWTDAFAQGWTREQVFQGFVDSQEWADICASYGIISGGSAVPHIKPGAEVIEFATRLYSTCLGREGEQEGLNNWADWLANHKVTGTEAAYGFFFSGEFTEAGHDDAEFLYRLYRTLMGREADPEGFNMWLELLETGAWNREQVFDGFAQSNEFGSICEAYGIIR